MGMNAELLGIGRVTESVLDNLEYPAEYYKNNLYEIIITSVISPCVGSSQSREFAECLGINPWDFGEHYITNEEAKKIHTEYLFDVVSDEDLEDFMVLRDAGFGFYFRPNG